MLCETWHKPKYGKGLKILTLKQLIQRLPIDLAEVKEGNTSKKLLYKIRQIIYSFYQAKEIPRNKLTI